MQRGIDYIGVGVGGMVFDDEGKVLLALRGEKARNQQGKWEFPGGAVEFNETLAETLTREAKEECDIEISILELIDVADDILPEEKQHWVSPAFICNLVSGTAKVTEPGKCDRVDWFNIDEIKQLDLSRVAKRTFASFLKKYPNGYKLNKPSYV